MKLNDRQIDKFLKEPILFPKLSNHKRALGDSDKDSIQHMADNVFASLENSIKVELLDVVDVKHNHVPTTKNATNMLHKAIDELLSHWKTTEDELHRRRLSKSNAIETNARDLDMHIHHLQPQPIILDLHIHHLQAQPM
eukprot:g1916.t1